MHNKIVNGICGYLFFSALSPLTSLFLHVVDELKNESAKNYLHREEILDHSDIKGVNVSYRVSGTHKRQNVGFTS